MARSHQTSNAFARRHRRLSVRRGPARSGLGRSSSTRRGRRYGWPVRPYVLMGLGAALSLAPLGCRKENPDFGEFVGDGVGTGSVSGSGTDSMDANAGGTQGLACEEDVDCPIGRPCGPMGTCQTGDEGDPCDGPEDCRDDAPICAVGGCQDGSEGDACVGEDECSDAAPICFEGSCFDGSEGDPCANRKHCSMELAPYCGPDRVCQDGMTGDPCVNGSQCAGNGCVDGACP